MTQAIIWLHDEALRITHPVFSAAPEDTKAIFIWNDQYFRQQNFSLKRLVFIYETLCDLPIKIISGNTLDVLKQLEPSIIYIPYTNNNFVKNIVHQLSGLVKIKMIEDESFVVLPKKLNFKRFFKYWNSAQKTTFMLNGSEHA